MTDEGGSDTDEAEEVLGLAFVAAVQAATSFSSPACSPSSQTIPASGASRSSLRQGFSSQRPGGRSCPTDHDGGVLRGAAHRCEFPFLLR
jgi:hypothetical protein